jgi:NB-ARC domain
MAVTLRASKKGLAIVDQARRKKGWNKYAYGWCDQAYTTPATLKRFWGGLPIAQDTFVNICQAVGVNWEEIVDNSPVENTVAQISCFAYDEGWVGREELVANLSTKLQGEYRVIILTGITGIGKTALAEKLAVDLQDNWSNCARVNFDDESKVGDFGSVTAELLIGWGEKITPDDREDTQGLLDRLVQCLQENRYLLLIDSLERILKGKEEEGWSGFEDEWWVKFFQRLLAADSCQSHIILTTQDLPAQIPIIGSRYPNFWHCQVLSGLEVPERLDLFEKTGLDVLTESPNRPYLERIGAAYEGHPLALRVIAGEIGNKPFFGNAIAYWNQYGNEIEEVEKAIEEAKTQGVTASGDDCWKLHRYTRQLRINVRARLEKTFKRLQKDVRNAYLLICESSVYRCPVSEDFWLSHLEDWDCNEEQQEIALDALRDRYLVEEVVDGDRVLLRQHHLIRSLALEHLQELDGSK